MDCVNHTGVSSAAFCQNCGKALCESCVRHAAGGQILCEPCWNAWQGMQQPFAAPFPAGPNPATAAVLGLIPGVGAMYNGQFLKAMIHVVVFAVLVSMAGHHAIFGLFIPAWILYQSFEAFHTAKARRDGQPMPDPLGLNELSYWINPAARPQNQPHPGAVPGAAPGSVPPGSVPPGPAPPRPAGTYQAPSQAYYPPPYQAPYQPPPAAGPTPPSGYPYPGVPPVPPPPPGYWHRKEPVGAIVLIALGLLFLLGQIDFLSSRIFEFTWPLLLIALGAWLIVRRLRESQGGPQ